MRVCGRDGAPEGDRDSITQAPHSAMASCRGPLLTVSARTFTSMTS
jgi:hypothetical protein